MIMSSEDEECRSFVLPILHGARQGGVRQDIARRITAHPPLGSLLGGVRQDSASRLPAYPFLSESDW